MTETGPYGKGWAILQPSATSRTPYYFEQLGHDYGDRYATRIFPSIMPETTFLDLDQSSGQDTADVSFALLSFPAAHMGLEEDVLPFDPNARGVFPDEVLQPVYSPLSQALTEELPRTHAFETQVIPSYELLWTLGGVRNRLRAIREYVGAQAVVWKEDASALYEDIRWSAQAVLGMFRFPGEDGMDSKPDFSWGEGFDMPEWNGSVTEITVARKPILGKNGERIYYSLPD